MTDWEKDALLDEAFQRADQCGFVSTGRAAAETQRRAVAALSREVGRLDSAQPDPDEQNSQPIAAFQDRLVDWEKRVGRSSKASTPRPISEAAGSVAERLQQIENRIAQRDAELANKPIVSALSRLEDRFDHLVKRNTEGAREAARVEATFRDLDARLSDIAQKLDRRESAPKTHAEIERIDGKLASILAHLDRQGNAPRFSDPVPQAGSPDVGAPTILRAIDRKGLRDSIADIAQRQADLDGTPGHRTSLLREASYPSIGQAQRERRIVASDAIASGPRALTLDDGPAAFATLQEAFAGLAARLETRIDGAIRTDSVADAKMGRDLSFLKSGIVGLEQRLDAIQQQTVPHQGADPSGNIAVLRHEIASLSQGFAELAAQQSAVTLDQAIRTLNERMEVSRLDGVSDAVLAPIEKLSTEMRIALRDSDPRTLLAGIGQQLDTIKHKVDGIEGREIDGDAFDALRDETREMHALLKAASGQFSTAERLESEFAQLHVRIDKLADTPPRAALRELELATSEIRTMLIRLSPTGVLQELSHKLDRIADRIGDAEDRMALPAALFDDLTRRIDEAHASLSERITAKSDAVDLRPIEAMLGGLSGKIDGLRHSTTDMQALGGLVRGLAAQIEDARLPTADAKVLDSLEAQVGRLAERLDRSDASLSAISSLERLIGDLFHQVDETRTATIEAAENAARTAAHEALRASASHLAEGSGNGLAQAADVVEQLAELRQSQHASEKRVHSTLLALNETLERMVDRLVKDAQAAPAKTKVSIPPMTGALEAVVKAEVAKRQIERTSADPAATPGASLGSAKRADLDGPATEVGPKHLPSAATLAAPSIEVNRTIPGEPMPDVTPLIAAARRAAQAAQASAQSAGREKLGKAREAGNEGKARAGLLGLLGRKRRPLLLSLAGVVLLLGALQMAKLANIGHAAADAETANLETLAGPEAAVDTAPAKTAASAINDDKAAEAAADAKTASGTPSSAVEAAAPPLKPDPAIAGLPAGLKDLALGGDANAQYEVGVRLSEDRGVTRDLKAAALWFERAAQQGLAPAQYRLGSLYEKGIGVASDPALAVQWYERAAAKGNIRAMHNLAVMSAEGAGAKPDYVKAASWFNKAAALGVRDSQFNLAILDARGLGVQQDLPQAYTWFSIAAAQGDADAARKRDDVGAKLDAKTLAAARAAADVFKPATADHAANDVTAPPGGWDAVPAKTATTPSGHDASKAKLSSM